MMRIIGGEYKSRVIAIPKGVDIRPTQDKVREAIFNILGDVNGRDVLELFAGSGSYGLEAISRGARHVTFVDNNFKCVETIRSNIRSLNLPDNYYDIIRSNAMSVLPRLKKIEQKFDLVFLDPPYYRNLAKKCLINIDAYDILTQNALVIAEHFKKDSLMANFKTLVLDKERIYSDTVISIFRRISDEKI